jgi:hypothetical chaperone protein
MTQSHDALASAGGIGLDFGTTNSAMAVVTGGRPVLATYHTADGPATTFPSIIYFERHREGTYVGVRASAGTAAVERYLLAEKKGRLIQSLKTCLADARFDRWTIFGKSYPLEDLASLIVRQLLAQALSESGAASLPGRVVVGQPVHFATSRDEADDAMGRQRLLAAVAQCGFDEVVFEYEPVAAAYSYSRTLSRDELILIGDFGGGTSDFCVLRIGPSLHARGRRPDDVLGVDGVAIAGDAFDRQLVRHLVAPALGFGSDFVSPPDKVLPMPLWPYERLERWHHVAFLDNPGDLERLRFLHRQAVRRNAVGGLIHLVREGLGYQLHEAVRLTKFELSMRNSADFVFECGPVSINTRVSRQDFEGWIGDELAAIAECVDRVMATAGVGFDAIDRVFLTGGSSFVPAVRRILETRFGADKMNGGSELTSVATGLALRAAELWPARAESSPACAGSAFITERV